MNVVRLLADEELERSAVVANKAMNRERDAVTLVVAALHLRARAALRRGKARPASAGAPRYLGADYRAARLHGPAGGGLLLRPLAGDGDHAALVGADADRALALADLDVE